MQSEIQKNYDKYQAKLSLDQVKTMGTKMLQQQINSDKNPEAYKDACRLELVARAEQREKLLLKKQEVADEVKVAETKAEPTPAPVPAPEVEAAAPVPTEDAPEVN